MDEPLHKAVFLDRDGTIIEDRHYLSDPARVAFLPGVQSALLTLQNSGYLLVIVSNQSGIGRGLLTDAQYQAVRKR